MFMAYHLPEAVQTISICFYIDHFVSFSVQNLVWSFLFLSGYS